MGVLFALIYVVLLLFLVALIIRLIIDWVQVFARHWRPRGAALLVASIVYSLSDPPLRFLRRVIPPLKMGNVTLDIAFILLFFVVSIAMAIASSFA
ncbi:MULTISPECIES: YggT family protein [Arthrobacter]|uniref:YggT family protein n=2 Tax=Arthrobacter TaxID=1663 RepID=A0ABU9KH21_9MICC|nr:YggT family protein [Arthrobacter sp. YJM1]MDP5226195.1 YggT family protein [Arthrobacter sp. YJM1]